MLSSSCLPLKPGVTDVASLQATVKNTLEEKVTAGDLFKLLMGNRGGYNS